MRWAIGPGSTTETALLTCRGRPQRAVILCTQRREAALGLSRSGGDHRAQPSPGPCQGQRLSCPVQGTEVALSPGWCYPTILETPPPPRGPASAPRGAKVEPHTRSLAQRRLSAAANLSRFSHRCEPISCMEGKKGTPHHSHYSSQPELQVTFPGSTEVAEGSTLVCWILFFPLFFSQTHFSSSAT